MASSKISTVDEYLAHIGSPEALASLRELREIILSEESALEEGIAYGIPTYKCHGYVASFAAFKKHCSFFPGHTTADFASKLEGYKISKGTIQFEHRHPLPEGLVREIIRARVEENRANAEQ